MMYFLKVSGVPMRYRFDIHFYGPYCREISRDTEWLGADGVVQDLSVSPEQYSNYAPGISLGELLDTHPDIEQWRDRVRTIVCSLVPLEPNRLELLATLEYLYRQQKAASDSSPVREAVIKHFMQIKGDKFTLEEVGQTYDQFTREDIGQAYDIMARLGLLEK
jgi:hypothetical protein